MIYWCCHYSGRHLCCLLTPVLILNILQFNMHLQLAAHAGIVFISLYWAGYIQKAQHQIPRSISYHKDSWRMTYDQRQVEGNLRHGYVFGPLMFIKLQTAGDQRSERLWLSYWQIAPGGKGTCQGNWRQLVTMIRSTRP